ncbi:MAG: O-antigen ligase family protein [Acidobacteriota bacterium]
MAKNPKRNENRDKSIGEKEIDNTIWSGKDFFSTSLFLFFIAIIFVPPFFRGLGSDGSLLPYLFIFDLIIMLAILNQWRIGKLTLVSSWLDMTILIYTLLYALSSFIAVDLRSAIMGALEALACFGIYWMAKNLIENDEHRGLAINTLLIGSLGVALITICAATGVVSYDGAFVNGIFMTTWQYSNTAAAYAAAFSILALILFLESETAGKRSWYLVTAALLAMILAGTASKGGLAVYIIGIVLALVMVRNEDRIKLASLSIVTMLLGSLCTKAFLWIIASDNDMLALAVPILLTLMMVLFSVYMGDKFEQFLESIKEKLSDKPGWMGATAALAGLVLLALVGKIWLPSGMASRWTDVFDFGNQSYLTRFDFVRWAIQIIKDHPIFGAGAGGWNALYQQYQDYLYWTQHVHSSIFEVGVEIGLLGLICFAVIWILYTLGIKKDKQEVGYDPLQIGGSVVVLILFIHSAFDFDFQISGMQLIVFALIGLTSVYYNRISVPYLELADKFLPFVMIGLVSSSLIFTTTIYQGLNYYAQAELADKAGNSAEAEKNYLLATTADPWAPEYRLQLGLLYAAQAASNQLAVDKREKLVGFTKTLTDKVQQDNAYGISAYYAMNKNYIMIGDYDSAITTAERCIELGPLNSDNYVLLAESLNAAAMQSTKDKEIEKTRAYLQKVIDIPNIMKSNSQRINQSRLGVWYGQKMRQTADMKLKIAIAEFLLGNIDQCKLQLQDSELKKEFPEDSKVLQAAVLQEQGQESAAKALLAEAYKKNKTVEIKFSVYIAGYNELNGKQ